MKRKKTSVVCCFLILVFAISSFTAIESQKDKSKPTNLKVLPKNISAEDLEATMKSFNKSLGVKCGFCHASKPNGEVGLDFSSDANPKKDIARQMMKMTNKINKKYFAHQDGEKVLTQIACITCHNGKTEPGIRHIPAK